MGNVLSEGGGLALVADTDFRFVQASDAVEMQKKVDDLFAQLATLPQAIVGDIHLGAAGDGHAFIFTLFFNPTGGTGTAGTEARIFQASSEPEILRQLNATIADLRDLGVVIEGYALTGASQSKRFMGVVLTVPGGG